MTIGIATARRDLSAQIEKFCAELGIEAQCPYLVEDSSGQTVAFAAFLPHFGSSSGLLVDVITEPDYATSETHKRAALKVGIPLSFVNPTSISVSRAEFIGALRDWGYFGPKATTPACCANSISGE